MITNFVKSEYWNLEGNFKYKNEDIFCKLISIKGKKVAIGTSFNKTTGKLESSNTVVLTKEEADAHFGKLFDNYGHAGEIYAQYLIANIEKIKKELKQKIKELIHMVIIMDGFQI